MEKVRCIAKPYRFKLYRFSQLCANSCHSCNTCHTVVIWIKSYELNLVVLDLKYFQAWFGKDDVFKNERNWCETPTVCHPEDDDVWRISCQTLCWKCLRNRPGAVVDRIRIPKSLIRLIISWNTKTKLIVVDQTLEWLWNEVGISPGAVFC